MIKNFSDLAANERTYLSWVRTAIAIMAFGFLIEKFELFLRVISAEVSLKQNLQSSAAIEAVGIMMMIVSVIIMVGSSIRYLLQRKYIMAEKDMAGMSGTIGFVLALFLILISVFLIGYIWIRLFQG